jgi:hypothetical protein
MDPHVEEMNLQSILSTFRHLTLKREMDAILSEPRNKERNSPDWAIIFTVLTPTLWESVCSQGCVLLLMEKHQERGWRETTHPYISSILAPLGQESEISSHLWKCEMHNT